MTTPSPLMSYVSEGTGLLTDKAILITGAAQGIGRAVAGACARQGANVLALDRKRRKLETLYDEITQAGYPEPILIPQDLQDIKSQTLDAIASGIEHDVGRLDGIAHIAGMLPGLQSLQSQNLQAWDSIMQVNLYSSYLITRACLPLLRQAANASIVFTSAACGRRGQAYWGAYGVAYAGIERLSEAWADELETNTKIRFNTLNPGPVATDMRMRTFPGETKNNLAQPEDVAPAYLFLLSKDSSHINGQSLNAQAEELG